jgi:hypothetical protein
MTTAGGFALPVGIFVVPQIVILRRCRLEAWQIWIPGLLSISLGHFAGWLIAPWVFKAVLDWHGDGLSTAPELTTLALISIAVGLVATFGIYLVKLNDERKQREMHNRIEKAKATILESGTVRGSMHPRVPRHKRRPRQRDRRFHTRAATGPYGTPLP